MQLAGLFLVLCQMRWLRCEGCMVCHIGRGCCGLLLVQTGLHVCSMKLDLNCGAKSGLFKEQSSTQEVLLVTDSRHSSRMRLRRDSHRSSASSSGPVETGFRNATFSSFQSFLAVRASNVAKMVLPTSVFAPNTWYTRRERQSSEANGDFMVPRGPNPTGKSRL